MGHGHAAALLNLLLVSPVAKGQLIRVRARSARLAVGGVQTH